MRERIRRLHCATLASCRSQQVADAGALAPVVFSGDVKPQTCEIRKIKVKERPIPPNSTPLSSMVPLVLIENGYIVSFERKNKNCPSHGMF